jgi:hypothetical protein
MFIQLTGDQTAFPADSRQMIDALGAEDLTTATIRGPREGEEAAREARAGCSERATAPLADRANIDEELVDAALLPALCCHWPPGG